MTFRGSGRTLGELPTAGTMHTPAYCLLFASLVCGPAFAQNAPQLPAQPTTIRIHYATPTTDSAKPLVVVDTFVTQLQYLVLEPSNIESINVLKDKTAIMKWGDKGRNGVIVITPKPNTRILTINGLYDHFAVPAGQRTLRVCINEKPVDHPELILVDLTAIDGISTFVSTNWNLLPEPGSESFFNIIPRKGPLKWE